MNKHQWQYMFHDTKLGLKRNKGAVMASVTLLFIALCLIGQLLLVRAYITEAVHYVESQVAMKVYVEDGMAQEVAAILAEQSYTKDVNVETGAEMIASLAFFFEGRAHLLESFTDGRVPDAVKFSVKDAEMMQVIAQNLEGASGIVSVVYPQQMAQILVSWIETIELYGVLVVLLFFVVAFMMVYSTCHLAMYKRQQELKVKLLLGMNPKIVRMQFLMEGVVLGISGACIAMLTTAVSYYTVYTGIHQAVPYLGKLHTMDLVMVCSVQLVMGVFLSVLASYISTRDVIADV